VLLTLIAKLREANKTKSLRELGKQCGVSHELIRKLVIAKEGVSITTSTFEKIQKGLQNGFTD
jgi:hypothetical protein